MNRKEMKQLLEERFERIALLETRIDTMEQLIEGYHAREQSLIDTLHTAQNTSRKLTEDARAEADAIREKARQEGKKLLDDTMRAAQSAMDQAQQQAAELRISAKNESDRMIRDAEIIKSEYEELVDSFNALLEQNANELRETADRFAEFVRGRKIEAPEVKLDGEAFYKSVGALNDARLPDPDGDPATLMKNIYQLQKRPLPTAENLGVEESGATEAVPAEERPLEVPYSEQAWTSLFEQSESEPQAEFTKSFDPAFTPSDVEVQSNECAIPAGQAEQAFDEYFSTGLEPSGKTAQDEVAPAQAEGPEGAIAEPYSEKAWAQSAFTSSLEPQAEGAAAFDELFGDKPTASSDPVSYEGVRIEEPYQPIETADESDASTQDASATEPYSEKAWAQSAFTSSLEPQAEGAAAFDELFGDKPTASSEPVSYEGVRIEEPYQSMETADESDASTQDVSATEPYSEMAWAQGAFTSNLEPQAEGAAAFDAMFSEPAGSGAFEASFESEQEPREWEPEREPDAEDIPTVSRYVSQANEEEVSLDALLEEIIKAGE